MRERGREESEKEEESEVGTFPSPFLPSFVPISKIALRFYMDQYIAYR